MDFMQYFCKNPECNNIFIAEDLYKRKTPETFRYCPKCEAKGFPKIRSDKANKNMVRPSTFTRRLF